MVRQQDDTLIGHNTDYFGFRTMLEHSRLEVSEKKVLILGSGGASATAQAVLQEANANVVVISRNGADNYDNLQKHYDAAVIVNATPVGMYPKTDQSPISLTDFHQLEGVLDLIYNPARTALLMDAEELGLVSINGLRMLVAQAKESAEWFTGRPIPDDVIEEIYGILSAKSQNIVLIGMPGCGKSTVGAIIAQRSGRKLVDADKEIELLAGKSIPQIFTQDGERVFRTLETQVLERLGKESGLVIATGGGCVTRRENYRLLHQNGIIYWLERNLQDLPTDGRPLSAAGNLEEMYRVRRPLYESFADHCITNSTPVEAAARILEQMGES
jgi:shikimate dehydrogenase